MRKLNFLVVMALLLSLLPSVVAQESSATVRVAMPALDSLDPTSVSRFDLNKVDLLENLLVGLTRLNANTGEVEPQLAREWSVSSDGLTWTFTLRDDVQWVKWENGAAIAVRPVVAGDVVFALQRACDPNRPSPVTANIGIIAGCLETAQLRDPWRVDQAYLNQHIGAVAVDNQTLQFKLLFPAAYFLTFTTLPEFRPLPAELISGAAAWPLATNLMTSGAWAVSAWDGEQMLLNANPFWPMEREGNAEQIEIRFGDFVSVPDVDIARIDALTAKSMPEFAKSSQGQTLLMLGFSFEYPPLESQQVRQALAQAINRGQLATQLSGVGNQDYQAASIFTPRTVIATPSTQGVNFDPTAAQQLLAAAGYPQCNRLPSKITVVVENTPLAITAGQYVVQQWQQNLGCAEGVFELAAAPRQSIVDSAHGTVEASEEGVVSRFQIWLVTWTADYPDANAWTADALHCQVGYMRTGRTCDTADNLLERAATLNDLEARYTAYAQAELALFGAGGSFPVVPLALTTEYWFQNSTIEGVASYGPFQFDRWVVR